MKKVSVSVITIAAFIVYAIFYHKSQSQQVAISTGTPKSQTAQSTQVIADQISPTTTVPTVAPTAMTVSQTFKDGSYTGKAVDAFYGNIQVKAIISGGKLTDVQFLQYPNDQHESIEINTEAMPILAQEAITAQSANVDIVSRATDSSEAFKESLASALTQAE